MSDDPDRSIAVGEIWARYATSFSINIEFNLMIRTLLVLALSILSACVTYKIEPLPSPDFNAAIMDITSSSELNRRLSVENIDKGMVLGSDPTEITKAVFCREPLLTVITLGIVPRTCVERYRATLLPLENNSSQPLVHEFKTTSVTGWLSLILLPLPNWMYGYQDDIGDTIKLKIIERSK